MHKLESNALYGTLITNKDKHFDIIYVDESEIGRQIISLHFYNMTELPDGYYEAESTKPSINLNIPIHVGVFILNYAKLHMLELYYDCVNKYLSHEDFIYCEMDNDLAYMAISGDIFESLIKPELKEEFEKDKHNWFVTPVMPQGKCTSGLFKVEFKVTKSLAFVANCIAKKNLHQNYLQVNSSSL